MSGPPPLPTALKVLRGNPGGRKLNDKEPKVKAAIPAPPKHLGGVGVQEWKRVADLLYGAGILTEIDAGTLAAYCKAYERWYIAERMIVRAAEIDPEWDGLMVRSAKGNPVANPLVGIANVAMRDMVKFAAEFGMTPSARSRIRVTDAVAESANPFVALKVS